MNRFVQFLAAITLLLPPLPLCAQSEVDSEQAREVKTLVEGAHEICRFCQHEF